MASIETTFLVWKSRAEEVDELWSEVKRKQSERDQDALITEALHVAAMATRFAVEIAITNHDK